MGCPYNEEELDCECVHCEDIVWPRRYAEKDTPEDLAEKIANATPQERKAIWLEFLGRDQTQSPQRPPGGTSGDRPENPKRPPSGITERAQPHTEIGAPENGGHSDAGIGKQGNRRNPRRGDITPEGEESDPVQSARKRNRTGQSGQDMGLGGQERQGRGHPQAIRPQGNEPELAAPGGERGPEGKRGRSVGPNCQDESEHQQRRARGQSQGVGPRERSPAANGTTPEPEAGETETNAGSGQKDGIDQGRHPGGDGSDPNPDGPGGDHDDDLP